MQKEPFAVATLTLAFAACSSGNAPEPAALPGGLTDLSPESVKAADENFWLEEVNGEKPLAWVKGAERQDNGGARRRSQI